MSNTNLYSVNHISKLLTKHKDNVTDSGGAIAYSFFIYNSQVDDVIKKYAMQYIYIIYILIFDEIIGKIAFPFEKKLTDMTDMTDMTNTFILYDTNFLSLEEQEFIDTFLSILNINDTIDEITPDNNLIKHIYENCFTLIQEYLHYEYNVTLSNAMTNTAPAKHILTRGIKNKSIRELEQILEYMLNELLQKTLPLKGITNIYKKLICLAITLCYILLLTQDNTIRDRDFWRALMENTIVENYIAKISTNLHFFELEKIKDFLIQIQHIMNSCLQSINIAGNNRRLQSIQTIMNALGTIGAYFITLFNSDTDEEYTSFNDFTQALFGVLNNKYSKITTTHEPIFLLCRMDIEEKEDVNDIQRLISSKTLYINFIDEIIALISLLTTEFYIDVTYIKDKLKHIILTNKIFRSRETISNKIEIFTNECKENINNFQLNYLSIATKFNSISNYNRQLLLERKPHVASSSDIITDTLVYGSPILYSLSYETTIKFKPEVTNTTNTCGLNEEPTLTYINPSYENLFCFLPS